MSLVVLRTSQSSAQQMQGRHRRLTFETSSGEDSEWEDEAGAEAAMVVASCEDVVMADDDGRW